MVAIVFGVRSGEELSSASPAESKTSVHVGFCTGGWQSLPLGDIERWYPDAAIHIDPDGSVLVAYQTGHGIEIATLVRPEMPAYVWTEVSP